ncbi:MAG: hypothetical protein QOJ72_979 [Nocardioidaceae bacterium]|nr:hypothetical protein [Nocardioidaceae bacterium]
MVAACQFWSRHQPQGICMKKTLTAATIVITLALAGGCGGGDRPSKGDLSKAIQKTDSSFSKKGADCAAKALLDSKISDKGLKAIADNDKKFKPSAADKKAQAKVSPALAKCLT